MKNSQEVINYNNNNINNKLMIIPIVIGAFGTVTKGLVQGLKDLDATGHMETVHSTALFGLARILRRILET